MKIHLVISNYNSDPRFLYPLADSHVVYDKSDNQNYRDLVAKSAKQVQWTENPGHNLCDILDYIIENYESLPPLVAFVKGNIVPRHITHEFLSKQLQRGVYSFLWDLGYEREDLSKFLRPAPGVFAEINSSWFVADAIHRYFLTLDEFLEFIFEGYRPSRFVTFSPGGCYLVERERISNNPRSLYQSLRKLIAYDYRTAECFMLERSLHLLFDRTYDLKDYCYDTSAFLAELEKRPDVSSARKSGVKKNRIDHYLWLINKKTSILLENRSLNRNILKM